MGECLILGDSLAVGLKQASRPACVAYARSGISSAAWERDYRLVELDAETVVISLGSNDGPRTRESLEAIRGRVRASRVVWVLPGIKPSVGAEIRAMAASWGDIVLEIPELTGDGVHATGRGYRMLAEQAGVR